MGLFDTNLLYRLGMIQGSPRLIKSATKAFRVDPIAWAPKVEVIQLIGIFWPQKRVENQCFHF